MKREDVNYCYNSEEANFEKFRNRVKRTKSGKKHESVRKKRTDWEEVARLYKDVEDDELFTAFEKVNNKPNTYTPSAPKKEEQKPVEKPVEKREFVFGPNTREIKNIKIDMDRVANITQENGEYEGHPSYGIKFLFKGNKGSFKIIWFGRNSTERDRVFNEEVNFWNSLKK